MSEIDFKINVFHTYEVQVEGLSLGFINPKGGGYNPKLNEPLDYDGNTVVLKDGREFSDVPQLRSAIGSGWLKQVGTKAPKVVPKTAGIQVRPTETRGNERIVKRAIVLEQSDERVIGSIADRQKNREATNNAAAQRVPLETQEAQQALQRSFNSGDDEIDEIARLIDDEIALYQHTLFPEDVLVMGDHPGADMAAEVEGDILSALDWVETDSSPAPPAPEKTARRLPVEIYEDRKTLPLVLEDTTDTAGTVVGNVGQQRQQRLTVIERDAEIPMNVAPARPDAKSPAPKPRFGSTGVIIVDEQRDMGRISLSSTAAPIRLDESVKVSSTSTEVIKMGDGAQVGTKRTASSAPPVVMDGDVSVGRVLSPTKTSFVASDANTSSTAIHRAAGGKELKVERYVSDEVVVGNVSDGAPARAVATGDVQEARAGDTLQDVLPDAVTTPVPEVYRRPETDPAYEAVKMMIPDFEWDKDRPVKVKVAAAIKHIKNPMYVKGILAVESNVVREEIKKALAAELKKRAKAKKKAK